MDQVTFLSTNWEKVDRKTGHQRELKIKKALKMDIEDGLMFSQLPGPYFMEAWWVLEGLVELRKAELAQGGVNWVTRTEWESQRADEARERAKTAKERDEGERKRARKKVEEDNIVNSMQRELNELLVELDKTEDGKLVRLRLEKADTELRKFFKPILAKIDSEGVEAKVKEKLQKEADEKYALHMRMFWGHFEEVKAMRIPIGPTLREFYGISEAKPPKKRFGLF